MNVPSDEYVVVVDPMVQKNHLYTYNENITRFIRLTKAQAEAETRPINVLNSLKKYIKGHLEKKLPVKMKNNHFIDLEAA